MIDSRNLICKAFEHGVNHHDLRTLGFHGTSLEAVKNLIDRGKLKAEKDGDDLNDDRGIIFWPNPNHAYFKRMQDGLAQTTITLTLTAQESYEKATQDAYATSKRHRLARLLRLNLDFSEHLEAVNNLWDLDPDEIKHYASFLKIDTKEIRASVKEVLQIEDGGVVLAIHENLLQHKQIEPTLQGSVKILCSTGLAAELICGIEPQSDGDWDYLSVAIRHV